MTADVSDIAGNAAAQVTSSSFTVDTSVPSINAIGTSAFSWGAVLNSVEDNNDGTVTVTTVGVEDGQTVTITLNGETHTANVSSNSATVTISASYLQALTNGQSYTMTADVSDAAGNAATQVTSSSFTVDTSAPQVVSFTISDTELKIDDEGTVILVFTEAVSGFDSDDDITATNGTLSQMTTNDNITWTGTFTPKPDFEGTGTIALSNTYTDVAGNTGVTASISVNIDTKPPVILPISVSPIESSAFSWGAVLNADESAGDRSVFVQTTSVEDNQQLTLSLNSWAQLGNSITGDENFSIGWLNSLSKDGSNVAISSHTHNENTGKVKVYKLNGSSWTQMGNDLNGEEQGDQFGFSISISEDGTKLAVGSPYHDSKRGRVQIYSWNIDKWDQMGSDIDGEAQGDYSGYSVSLSSNGNVVAIGSPNNYGNGSQSGHVRIFEWNGSIWVQRGDDVDGMIANPYYSSLSKMITYSISTVNPQYNTYAYLKPIHDAIQKWDDIVKPPSSLPNYKLHIDISFDALDPGVLGGAWIETAYTLNGSLVFGESFANTGKFILSTSYLDPMKNNILPDGKSQLYYVALHEIGHILGIGPWWTSTTNVPRTSYIEDGVTKYYYTGTNAFREYKNYFPDISNTFVGIPIEDDGGAGTEHVHPEEDGMEGDISVNDRYINGVFHPGLDHELMTGWAESDVVMPLSRITIGFLEDIGYNVDYSEADLYDPSDNTVITPSSEIIYAQSIHLSSDGNTVAIGTPKFKDVAGYVRVYNCDSSNNWTKRGSDIDGESLDDDSGTSVSLSSNGEVLAIGAPGAKNSSSSKTGHVRVYNWNSPNWVQKGSDIDGSVSNGIFGSGSGFGCSVSLSDDGNTFAAGAAFDTMNNPISGTVAVYKWNGSSWDEYGNEIGGIYLLNMFGTSVSLSSDGSRLSVTSTGNNSNQAESGEVRVFELDDTMEFTSSVIDNSASVIIPAVDLQKLTNGSRYRFIANVSDLAGNAATPVFSSKFLVDTMAPIVNEVKGIGNFVFNMSVPVQNLTIQLYPTLTVSLTEAGTLSIVNGSSIEFKDSETLTVTSGNPEYVIEFKRLPIGTYTNQQIKLTDLAGNETTLTLNQFRVLFPTLTIRSMFGVLE
jgi:hypothetical protein